MDTERHAPPDNTLEIFTKNFRNLSSFYHFMDVFDPRECEFIINTFDPLCLHKGAVFGDKIIQNTRNSEVAWIPRNNTTEWIYDRLLKYASIANQAMFGLDITTIHDKIQFTKYREGGKYCRHMDTGELCDIYSCRKLSITVQLSDDTLYSGGDLIVRGDKYVPRKLGSACVFPSFLEHEVTPILEGTRYSLVLWLYGPQFK